MTASSRERELEPVYHHYGPHRAGLPPLVPYFKELWARRAFATEMSRATMRGAHVDTFFGRAWLVINPLMLAGVYYLLVTVIRGNHDPTVFTHLALGLFAFNLVGTSVSSGATSVTSSGRLLINTAFPRLLIPLSAVRTAFFRFLPTVPVYLAFHLWLERTFSWHWVLSLYFLGALVLFSMGLAAFFGALTIYFRDTSQFLPFFVRMWMYLSPVLWLPQALETDVFPRAIKVLIQLNPLYAMLGGYAETIQEGRVPSLYMWLASAGWALAVAVFGFLFFMSREREFAVRLS